MNCSRIKNVQKPRIRYENKVKVADDVLPTFKMASGKRWRKAPPSSPPADKATRISRILFIISSLMNRVKDPTQAMRLITNVHEMVHKRGFIYLQPFRAHIIRLF